MKETCSFDETVQFARNCGSVVVATVAAAWIAVDLEVKTSRMPLLWMHTSSNTHL